MGESRIERVQRLFLSALEFPEDEREKWLADQCRDDVSLLEEVLTLLQHDEPSKDPLENPLHEAIADARSLEKLDADPDETHASDDVLARALHVRCPHCHNPIELVNESFAEIECPSCGSSFSLLGEETVRRDDRERTAIAHYSLQERVGTGAFGSVWKAHDERLDRIVAIKIPRKGQLSRAESELFLREARSAAQLKHPNIVSVHEVGRDEDQVYIVSDFIDGETLSSWLTRRPLTPKEGAGLIAQIAHALHHAHESGVIHRDLKPANIIMDSAGEPHLVDFGLAKREAGEITMTADGKILGTPAYMSPELARGEASTVDRRSDIYSLGVVLFEVLTGEKPFRGDVRMLLHQVLHDEAPGPRTLNANLPRDLDTICLKCLQKAPEQRYATAEDLASDLEWFLKGEPISARPISSLARFGRWCQRNPKVATLVGTVFLLLCLVAVGGVISSYLIDAERSIAVENEAEAKRQEGLAKEERNTAQRLRSESVRDLVSLQLANGMRVTDEGDGAAGLLWYTKALATAEAAGMNTDIHRMRVANLASKLPRPVAFFDVAAPMPTGAYWSSTDEFSRDGRYRAIGSRGDLEQLLGMTRSEIDKFPEGFTPEQRTIYLQYQSGRPRELTIWDMRTNQQIGKPIGSDEVIQRWYWSQDGKRLVTEFSSNCRVWDRDTGEPVSPLISGVVPGTSIDPRAKLLVASTPRESWEGPDGRRMETPIDDRRLIAWDVETGRQLYEVALKEGADFKLSPTGERLAVFGKDGVQIRRAIDGSMIKPMLGRPADPGDEFKSVVFSQDETLLAANCGISGSKPDALWIWKVETGEVIVDGLSEDVSPQSFSADGTMLLTLRRISRGRQHGNTSRLWNTRTGEAETREFPQEANVSHAVLSPDGRLVVTASYQGKVQVWKIGERTRNQGSSIPRTTELACSPIRNGSTVNGLRFSADGKRLFIAGGDRVGVWELPSVSKTEVLFGRSISLSRNGSRAAYFPSLNSRVPLLLDLKTRSSTEVRGAGPTRATDLAINEDLDGQRGHRGISPSIWMSDDGSILVSAGLTNPRIGTGPTSSFRVWNATTGERIGDAFEQLGEVEKLRISPDGNRFAISTYTSNPRVGPVLRIHAPSLGKATELPFARGVRDMVFTLDSNRMVLLRDDSIECLDADSGQVLKRKSGSERASRIRIREYVNKNVQRQIQLSSDGKRIAAILSSNVAQVWDARTLEPISPTIPHQANITHIAFDPSGQHVATICEGGRAHIWDAESGEAICPPLMHSFVIGYGAFSPDGRLLLTVGIEDARVWEVSTGIPVLRDAAKFNLIQDAAFSADGSSIVFVADGQVVEQEILSTKQPKEVLESIAEVLAGGNQIDATGSLSQLSQNSLPDMLNKLQDDTPNQFERYKDGALDSSNQPPLAIAPFSANQAADYQQAWAEHLGVDAETTNSIGIKLRVIPPGTFLMGASDIEFNQVVAEARKSGKVYPDFLQQHLVTLSQPYMLSDREITRGQFRKFVEATGYETDAEKDLEGGAIWRSGEWALDHKFIWNASLGFGLTDEHPVVNVTWNDAVAFCQWLSEEEGVDYHLPTEAQWEFACRAGTASPYSFGIDGSDFGQFAWVSESDVRTPSPTGQLKANPFGLLDMHGNILEWCLDGYLRAHVPNPSWNVGGPLPHEIDPLTLRSEILPSRFPVEIRDGDPLFYRFGSLSRVARGGNFVRALDEARSAARFGRRLTHRGFDLGFRVAKGGLVSKHQSVIEALHEEGIQTSLADRERIELRGHQIDDADLQDLAGSEELLVLDVANTAITNEGLKHLAECQNLQLLDIDNAAVTDDGLHHLSGLEQLTTLHLSGTGVTDQGLSHLGGLVNLQRLDLNDTAMTGAGLVHLQDLPLLTLSLSDTKIDLPGMENVAKLEGLERLYLNRAPVSDAGLAEISQLQKLKYLHLAGTQITDEGLGFLGNLPNLQVLFLDDTKITSRGIKRLQELSVLASLSLTGTNLGDESIEDLSTLTGLGFLDIRATQISAAGVSILRKKLRPYTDIRH